jgi:predicted enzyme related to lactoylglutathione lyase
MAKVLGVGGLFFKSANPRKLARWYRDTLGMSFGGSTFAMFKPATMPKKGYTVWAAFPASSQYFKPSKSRHMVNLVVDDVEEALAQVVAAGARAVGKVRSSPYGRFGWFLDPDGTKIELWQLQVRKTRKHR